MFINQTASAYLDNKSDSYDKIKKRNWLIIGAAGFLVSVPVLIQASLVRYSPELTLGLTLLLLALARVISQKNQIWGNLILGFSWSWLAGSIYWGWFRSEPLIHLPIEAIALPLAIWGIIKGQGLIGHWFYLGSLLGTAITDLYFYLVDLIPQWRQLMVIDPALATPIIQEAIQKIATPWGFAWAIVLINLLLGLGLWSLNSKKNHYWVFGGALLSTILVDALFWIGLAGIH